MSLHVLDQISCGVLFFFFFIWFILSRITCPKLKTDRQRVALPQGGKPKSASQHSLELCVLSSIMYRGICFPIPSFSQGCASHYKQRNDQHCFFGITKNVIMCTYGQRHPYPPSPHPTPLLWLSVGLWQSGPMWFHSAFKATSAGKTTVVSRWECGFFFRPAGGKGPKAYPCCLFLQ